MEHLFKELLLNDALQGALEKRGFERPTDVQYAVLTRADDRRDLVARARTGSGKTLAFLLPLLQRYEGTTRPTFLILSPTRELAQQIAGEAEFFGRAVGCKVATLVGGMDMERQIRDLKRGASLIVGTPGRTLDHLRRGSLKLDELDTLVLDEGDNMLDMGFREELESILTAAGERAHTWLFSATVPEEITELIDRYLNDPEHLSLDQEDEQHSDITHRVYLVPTAHKYQGLVNVLLWEHPALCLVFCRTRADTAELTERLQEEGFMALPLHGDMSQRERNSALVAFRSGRVPILVATNVAARGLDIGGVSHVVQLGLPESLETFVHRSGRTGRAGHEGVNILVLTPSESSRFKFMIRQTDMQVDWQKVPAPREINLIQRELQEGELLAFEPTEEHRLWAKNLLNKTDDPLHLMAQLLGRVVGQTRQAYNLTDLLQEELDRRSARRAALRPRGRAESAARAGGGERAAARWHTPGGLAIRISKGRKDDDWSVGRILGALCGALGVDRGEIGNIRMRDNHTEVELSPKALVQLDRGGRLKLEEKGLLGSNANARPVKAGRTPVLKPTTTVRLRRFDEKGRRIDGRKDRRN